MTLDTFSHQKDSPENWWQFEKHWKAYVTCI